MLLPFLALIGVAAVASGGSYDTAYEPGYAPVFEFGAFCSKEDIPLSLAIIRETIDYLTRVNEHEYRMNASLGDPRKGGVEYKRVRIGRNDTPWMDAITMFKRGYGDCKVLSAARVAYLRVRQNVRCVADFRWKWVDGRLDVHVYVRYLDGRKDDVEDISSLVPQAA